MKQQFLEAGKIVSTHGVRGEVKILPWADDADFLVGLPRMFVDGREYAVQHSRVQKTCVLMKLAGIDDVDAAAKFRDKTVCISRTDVALPEGSVFIADLIGLRVVTDTGDEIGTVSDIMTMPGNNVYIVSGSREYLIPAVPEFILERNLDAGFVRVKLIEGM